MKLAVALSLAVMLWRNGFHADDFGSPAYVVHPKTRVNFDAESSAVRFLQEAVGLNPARCIGLSGNMFPGWNGVYGIEGIGGVDALSSKYLHELGVEIE